MNRLRTAALAAGLALAAPVALAACGSASSGSTQPTSVTGADVTVVAKDISFDQKQYSASAGSVTIAYVNKGSLVHTMVLEDPQGTTVSGFRLVAAPGKTVTGAVTLTAGTYTMICDVPGHKAAGMIAKLVVS